MSELIPYIPIAIAILAASLGYISGQRNGKIARFHQQVDLNLKEVCGPLFFRLHTIFKTEDPQQRESLIDSFSKDFSTSNPNIYKIGNKFLID